MTGWGGGGFRHGAELLRADHRSPSGEVAVYSQPEDGQASRAWNDGEFASQWERPEPLDGGPGLFVFSRFRCGDQTTAGRWRLM